MSVCMNTLQKRSDIFSWIFTVSMLREQICHSSSSYRAVGPENSLESKDEIRSGLIKPHAQGGVAF